MELFRQIFTYLRYTVYIYIVSICKYFNICTLSIRNVYIITMFRKCVCVCAILSEVLEKV